MSWIKRLQERWKLNTAWQVCIVLIVFACTGTTVYLLKNPLLRFFFGDVVPLWARILYYLIILPLYNALLLFYGFLFGQFSFFWEFEKKGLKKVAGRIRKKPMES